MISSLPEFFLDNWFRPLSNPSGDLTGQTVLLTGATSGIGWHAAVKFAQLGASKIVLGVRNMDVQESLKEQIISESGRTPSIVIFHLDLESFESVVNFSRQVRHDIEEIHIAVLNAGVQMIEFETTNEGWEVDLQVNTLSTVLLALLLLPKLSSVKTHTGNPAHLVFTSSSFVEAVETEKIFNAEANLFNWANRKENFNYLQQYSISKLFLEYAKTEIMAMTRQANGEINVIVTSTCPGMTRSNLIRHQPWGPTQKRMILFVVRLFARPAEMGSRAVVGAAMLPENFHGKMWKNDQEFNLKIYDSSNATRFREKAWKEMIEILAAKAPEINEIIGSFKATASMD